MAPFPSSVASKLLSDWPIDHFLRYVCHFIVVLQVAVCANGRHKLPLCVMKCDARVEGNKLYSVTSQSPACFVSQAAASLSNAFVFS